MRPPAGPLCPVVKNRINQQDGFDPNGVHRDGFKVADRREAVAPSPL
jgi:hypothetical protein